jgi:eukaryotic-like serine/threonine-protein kinase
LVDYVESDRTVISRDLTRRVPGDAVLADNITGGIRYDKHPIRIPTDAVRFDQIASAGGEKTYAEVGIGTCCHVRGRASRSRTDRAVAAELVPPNEIIVAGLPAGVFPPVERSVVRVDRTGRSETLPIPPRAFATLRLSSDGQQIALNTFGRDRDIWMYSLARETLTRLSLPGRLNVPIWSRDGHWITYASSTAGTDKLYRVRADGGGVPEQLIASEHNLVPGAWTAAGELLYYPGPSAFVSGTRNGALKGIPAPPGSQNRGGVHVSPDGRWIAYHSDDSGQLQVYVQAHHGPGPRYQVSTDGGMSPIWRADGRELFYARQRVGTPAHETLDVQMMAVGVTTQPALTLGKPCALFEGPYQMNQPARGYDVTADGQRFLLIQARERPPDVITQMIVVQNWFEELKRLPPVN